MTDLQCAARLFVARHGEAGYESELLSDAGGWLTRQIADTHRGESVRDHAMPHTGVVDLEADADGWVARSWAGSPLETR